ncbi:hypothetical protein C8J56DRAFT_1032750 [Mycena floridula]|nr:hypothetical protein C8J56DRAFT_1032750 [Mycena floridula]
MSSPAPAVSPAASTADPAINPAVTPARFSDEVEEEFAHEITRQSSSVTRAEWNELEEAKAACTACIDANRECETRPDGPLRCQGCIDHRLRGVPCSRVTAERRWRVMRNLGLSSEEFDQLLALYEQAEAARKAAAREQDATPPVHKTAVASSSTTDSAGSAARHLNRALSPMSNGEHSGRPRSIQQPSRYRTSSSPPPRPRIRSKPTESHVITELKQEIAAKDARIRKLENDRTMLKDRFDDLETASQSDAQHRLTEVTQAVILCHTVTQVFNDFDAKKISAEQGLNKFRQLPEVFQKDLQWRMQQLPAVDFSAIGLATISGIVGRRMDTNISDSEDEEEARPAKRQRIRS